jgi:hypothetical protein
MICLPDTISGRVVYRLRAKRPAFIKNLKSNDPNYPYIPRIPVGFQVLASALQGLAVPDVPKTRIRELASAKFVGYR